MCRGGRLSPSGTNDAQQAALDSRGGNMATDGYLERMQQPDARSFKLLHRDVLSACTHCRLLIPIESERRDGLDRLEIMESPV